MPVMTLNVRIGFSQCDWCYLEAHALYTGRLLTGPTVAKGGEGEKGIDGIVSRVCHSERMRDARCEALEGRP